MALQRSPNYPGLNLEEAIERVTRIYRAEHTHAAAQIAVINDLGYSSASGRALSYLGALRAYTLLEGRGDLIRVSESAVAIIEFSNEPANVTRIQALRTCAFAPTIFQEMHEQFGDRPPSDATIRHWLIARGFLSKAADEVIHTYRENLEFLNRAGVAYNSYDGPIPDSKIKDIATPKVGDYVQWESSGVLQFAEPKRLREISDDGGWAFVEGSNTGMPVNELTIETAPEQKRQQQPSSEPPKPKTLVERSKPQASLLQDVFTLPEGQITIQWPEELTTEGFQDFKDWLSIIERKIGRSVKAPKVASLETFSKSTEE